jgi:tRNA (guanosine-2'-O-)-methyltransferase
MKFPEQTTILEQYSADVIIEHLSPYINQKRQERIDDVIQGRLDSIQLVIECPSDINNAFAAIRTAEALGISKVHIITPEGTTLMAKPITQGAFYWVDIIYYNSFDKFLDYAKQQQLALAGGAVDASIPLAEVPVDEPLCILIGNEQRGLSPQAQTACNYLYKIPMVGMSESMNLSVSAAISLYDTTQRKRHHLGSSGDLSTEQQSLTRAKYFLNSVAPRLARGLFLDRQ